MERVGIENMKTWAEVNRGAIILCWYVRHMAFSDEVPVLIS